MTKEEFEGLTEAAEHWRVSYEIEARKSHEVIKFLEMYFGTTEWPLIQKALFAHMACIDF